MTPHHPKKRQKKEKKTEEKVEECDGGGGHGKRGAADLGMGISLYSSLSTRVMEAMLWGMTMLLMS